jgi:hypothetical protein
MKAGRTMGEAVAAGTAFQINVEGPDGRTVTDYFPPGSETEAAVVAGFRERFGLAPGHRAILYRHLPNSEPWGGVDVLEEVRDVTGEVRDG